MNLFYNKKDEYKITIQSAFCGGYKTYVEASEGVEELGLSYGQLPQNACFGDSVPIDYRFKVKRPKRTDVYKINFRYYRPFDTSNCFNVVLTIKVSPFGEAQITSLDSDRSCHQWYCTMKKVSKPLDILPHRIQKVGNKIRSIGDWIVRFRKYGGLATLLSYLERTKTNEDLDKKDH